MCRVFLFVFFFSFETGYCYIAQPGLELTILLPQPPKCWDYRHAPTHVASSFFLNERFYCGDCICITTVF
jgi:hypothetical protein